MIDGSKGRGLVFQRGDQVSGGNFRMAGDVVDGFFRIEGGALAADLVQHVQHVTFHTQHAALENREQSRRTGADNGDVGLMFLAGGGGRHG